ncbi:hypothetical protein SAY86_011992 [Trapa natans]|uniref:Protein DETOXIFICATION n=1 Tax=Trapa natans TaxID=22666 RepID=A0AAN7RCH1_TRANT|nr:hypothetical protein SAY86_011992 [Trapa natans]
MASRDARGQTQPLIPPETRGADPVEVKDQTLARRLRVETNKLWQIVGPAIFSRVAAYSMNIVSQSFAGHIGAVELAAFSIANNVIIGFNFGLLQADGNGERPGELVRSGFWGQEVSHAWDLHAEVVDDPPPLLLHLAPCVRVHRPHHEAAGPAGALWVVLVALIFNMIGNWLCVYVFNFGIVGICIVLDISWWILVVGLYVYTAYGGCPHTWTGFSVQAFSGLWELAKLSLASGVMLCLENWYYRILILMTGYLRNATMAVDALSICMSINGWEMMIPLAFFAATGVRVSNELGDGNGSAAKFATKVSVVQSMIIGIFFCALIVILHAKIAYIFTSAADVVSKVNELSYLLGITIILNSVQPILSGVAVGSGWQAYVAYINLFCYYIVGLPLGILMGWVFKLGVKGIWGGMIFGGTAVQTIILTVITMRTDWDNEAKKARERVDRFSQANPNDGNE